MSHDPQPTACITISRATDGGLLLASLDPRAAGLRALSLGGSQLVQSYPEGSEAPYYSGRTLLPWPNRLAQGTWTHEGHTLTVPINDPDHQAALHGLLSATVYSVAEQTPSSVVFQTTLQATPGYPFSLEMSVHYVLEESGLRVTHQVANRGDQAAPVAAGAHPFLRAGEGEVSEATLTSPVRSFLVTDENLIPTGEVALHFGDALNLAEGVALAESALDTAFRLQANQGASVTRLASPSGHVTELWQDAAWGWVQVFLTSTYPTPDGNVWAVAVEPMTAPPNALATGEDLVTVMPGEVWSASWGVRGTLP